ncbi:MAG: hypothetical protein KDA43_13970 [Hyphomonas sp.]|nr:hypothetical protein [Hyphomonas sp.]
MNEICILSAPRSGTSHMCLLWRSFRDHASFGEILHQKMAYGCDQYLADLNAAFGISAAGIADSALTKAMRNDPVLSIETLKAACGRAGQGGISYKIFPQHLEQSRLQAVLNRDGLVVVFVKRLLIDSYISSRKAQALNTWSKTDTTGHQVSLNFAEFEKWADSRRWWFRKAENFLTEAGRPFRTLYYEADISCDPAQHLAVARDVLGDMGLDIPLSETAPESDHKKQDTSQNYHSKVSNWSAFCHEARSRGKVERLWSYA